MGLDFVRTINFALDKKKPLLIAIDHVALSLHAHDAVNNKLRWSTKIHGDSITADGQNYVLVRNDNDICMHSLSDGKALGCLIREGDDGLGKPQEIQWCKMSSSLVVVHIVDKEYHITNIQFE